MDDCKTFLQLFTRFLEAGCKMIFLYFIIYLDQNGKIYFTLI